MEEAVDRFAMLPSPVEGMVSPIDKEESEVLNSSVCAAIAEQKTSTLNGDLDEDSDDDKPLSTRLPSKHKPHVVADSDGEDDVPLAQRSKSLAAVGSSQVPAQTKGKSVTKVVATVNSAVVKKVATSSGVTPKGNAKAPVKATTSKSPPAKTPPTNTKTPPAKTSTSKAAATRAVASSSRLKRLRDEPDDDEVLKKPKVEAPAAVKKGSPIKRPAEEKPTSSYKKPKVEEEDSEESCSVDEEEEDDESEEDEEDEVPISKRASAAKSAASKKVIQTRRTVQAKTTITTKKAGAAGQRWTTLEHNAVIFPPPYQPHGVKMLYDGKPVDLTPEQEEVATMFAIMRDTDYAAKAKFRENFWEDWKKLLGASHTIKKLELCDFTPIYEWHLQEKEKKKQMTSEEKKRLKEEKAKLEDKYMWAVVDGVKEKVGSYKVEPPNLFRGRGEHPKMGKFKRRIFPEDIVINIGKDAPIPECPMPGHRWKEIRHDNTVTWLAFWNDPINTKECKYVFLHQSSSMKAQSDKEKYEKARKLKDYIERIRRTYTKDFTSSDLAKRQIAVATYLIDRLALRAGNEKDDDEADTVGCCSLKVEHVSTVPPNSLEFDFLGKDSIRYFNTVEVEEKVYAAIKEFKKGKKEGDDLFDKLDTNKLNAHLKEFMPGLTAKVFRTYNASITLDSQLEHTVGSNVNEKTADYMRANKQVAILCNHQRSVPKTHTAQMEKLEGKMAELKALRDEIVNDLDRAKKGRPPLKDKEGKTKRNQSPEQLEKKLEQTNKKIEKMELDMRTKDDMKTVALGTSKINYMDPRITVAWCKRNEVPIEKVFNKSLLGKFTWAMDIEPDFRF